MKTELAKRLRKEQTEAEQKLWSKLRNRRLNGYKFKRQVPKGPYVVDYYCAEARLIIELDGSQHGYDKNLAHDETRTRYLYESGHNVIRFWNSDVFKNLDGVLQTIWLKLQEPPLQANAADTLSPMGRGRGEGDKPL